MIEVCKNDAQTALVIRNKKKQKQKFVAPLCYKAKQNLPSTSEKSSQK